jgi:hypothetical protein
MLLVHLVELDSEAPRDGPFSTHANAVIEYIDELIGTMLADLPRNYVFVFVPDHGFERIDREVNLSCDCRGSESRGQSEHGRHCRADTADAGGDAAQSVEGRTPWCGVHFHHCWACPRSMTSIAGTRRYSTPALREVS